MFSLEFLPKLVHSHAGFAYLSLILLLTRGALSARMVDWRKIKLLRIAPHAVDTLLLVSGACVLYGYVSNGIYSLAEMHWILPKLAFLVLYVVFTAKAFKKNQPFSLKFFLLAVASFMLAIMTAVMH